jgi:hypothetical protein
MNRIHPLQFGSCDGLRRVAIFISAVSSEQRHLAIIHGDATQPRLLELRWHHALRDDPIPTNDRALWLDPAVDARRLRQVAAICRLVARANAADGIPYGFGWPNDCFDTETGAYLIGPSRRGLTCASFALAVFHLAGLPLVEYASWPIGRSEDVIWQNQILALLETTGATPEHVAAVRGDVGRVRFRPEEVAGASVATPLPAPRAEASRISELVLARLYVGQSE